VHARRRLIAPLGCIGQVISIGTRPALAKEGIGAWMYGGNGEKSYQAGQRFRFPQG